MSSQEQKEATVALLQNVSSYVMASAALLPEKKYGGLVSDAALNITLDASSQIRGLHNFSGTGFSSNRKSFADVLLNSFQ